MASEKSKVIKMTNKELEEDIAIFRCPHKKCPVDGKEHSFDRTEVFRDENGKITGGGDVCSKCGIRWIDIAIFDLP